MAATPWDVSIGRPRERMIPLTQSTINISAGYGRNRAIAQSSGMFLCFLDAVSCVRWNSQDIEQTSIMLYAQDDVMTPGRIGTQHAVALSNPGTVRECDCTTAVICN